MKIYWKLTLADGTVKKFDADLVYPRASVPDAPPAVMRHLGLVKGKPFLSIVSKWEPDLANINRTYRPDEWKHIELINPEYHIGEKSE